MHAAGGRRMPVDGPKDGAQSSPIAGQRADAANGKLSASFAADDGGGPLDTGETS